MTRIQHQAKEYPDDMGEKTRHPLAKANYRTFFPHVRIQFKIRGRAALLLNLSAILLSKFYL